MAVLMHDFSTAKLSRIETAETLYLRAIDAVTQGLRTMRPSRTSSLLHAPNVDTVTTTPSRILTYTGPHSEGDVFASKSGDSDMSASVKMAKKTSPKRTSSARNFSRPLKRETTQISPVHSQATPSKARHFESRVTSFKTNATTFLTQLHTHLHHLRALRKKTQQAQAERAAKRERSRASTGTGTMQGTRSYWSFGDSAVKDEERTKKIEEGRARGWKRDREAVQADVDRYRRLAETAVAELEA